MRTLVPMLLASLLATHAYSDDKHHPLEAAAKAAPGNALEARSAYYVRPHEATWWKGRGYP